jgi:putative inorganic carbon (HCO3(-)) transporter
MSADSQSVARVQRPDQRWVAVWIAAASASVGALFVTEPLVFAAGLMVLLALAALLRFDYFVYGTVFLLPWYPLLNSRFQDAFLPLRFILFVGIWLQLRRENESIREWLVGSKWKKRTLFFAGTAVASTLLSGVPSNLPSYHSLGLLASYLAVFYAIDGWLENRNQLVLVLKLLLISTIGVALFGFYQAIAGGYTDFYFQLYPVRAQTIAPWSGRITSLLFQYNSLAGYLNLVIPIAAASAVLARDRVLKFLGFTCACTAAVAVVLTQSRGGLLALAGLTIMAVWLLAPRLTIRIEILCGITLICLLTVPPLLNHFDRLQGVDDYTEFGRLAAWQAAVSMFLEHPLLGVGYGNYKFLSADLVPGALPGTLEAHNLYLELLAETGLVGFLSIGALLGAFFFLSLKAVHKQDPLSRIIAFGVCGAIITTLIHGTVDYLFDASPQFGALFWMVLGIGSWVLARPAQSPVTATP